MTDVLRILVVLGSGVTTGVLFGIALAVMPALMQMAPGPYVITHQLIGQHWDPTMPAIVLGTFLLDSSLVVLSGGGAAGVAHAVAAVAMLAVAVVSHFGNVPINIRIKRLDPDAIPDDWPDPRVRWRNWNLARFCCALLALTANAVGVAVG